jgi:hypothetical protein
MLPLSGIGHYLILLLLFSLCCTFRLAIGVDVWTDQKVYDAHAYGSAILVVVVVVAFGFA